MEEDIVTNTSLKTGIKPWEIIAAIVLIGVMVFTVLACSSTSSTAAKLEGVTWVLKSYGGPNNPAPAIISKTKLVFNKKQMQINGNGGANGYGGDYKINGDKITFSNVIHTEMASTNQALNTQENSFFKILNSAASFKLSGGQLTITGTEGALVFSQQ
jgi:heat shock protein HslJ